MTDIKPDRKNITLTDGKILLRPYRMSDADDIYQAIRESIKEVGAWLPFAHEGYAIKETKDWLKKQSKEWKKGNTYDFGIFDAKDGAFIGGCGINGYLKNDAPRQSRLLGAHQPHRAGHRPGRHTAFSQMGI